MGGIFKNCQIVVMGNKAYPGFHTSDWMLMTVDMTPLGGRNKKWFSQWVYIKCTVNSKDATERGKWESNSILVPELVFYWKLVR